MARPLIRGAALLGTGLLIGLVAGSAGAAVAANRDNPYAALDLFARVLTEIQESFVDPIPQHTLVYHALDGLDNALDAHSVFLEPEAFRRLREEAEGQYVGIGAQTREDPRGLRVVTVLKDGPAARAGLQPGDLIVAVDGTSLAGVSLDQADARVRGREGDAVTLAVERDGVVRQVPLLRTRVQEASVEVEPAGDGLAYARILQFREGTAAALAAQLGAVHGLKGVVVDVRSNPGGRLDEAVATVDLFVRSGRIVSTRGRRPGGDEVRDAHDDKGDLDVPLVVLVDGQSASAAEILAGALRDLERATLVGERTYGKGSVQSLFEYEDGSALKLTIARYYLPGGKPIADRAGIEPDVLVRPALGEGPVQRLKKRLEKVGGLASGDRAQLLELVAQLPAEAPPLPPEFSGPLKDRLAKDPQLRVAVDTLRQKAK